MVFAISEQQTAALAPAFLYVDKRLNISAIGPAISRHLPGIRIGMPCAEVFKIVNYDLTDFFENGSGVRHVQILVLETAVSLFGNAIFLEAGCLLSLRFTHPDEGFEGSGLTLGDFAQTDPFVLSTMLVAIQRAMLEESQGTAIELAEQRQYAADALERTKRVAGYMAHDFNNILSIIQLNADRLTRQFGRNNDKIDNLADIIHKAASRGSDITKSLMALSHQNADTLQPLLVDVIIRDNIDMLNSIVGANITWTVNLHSHGYKSVVSHNGLLNTLINLLINARDAMPKGGKIDLSTSLVSAASDEGQSVQTAGQNHKYIAICISDNGRGMSKATLSRAFEPMFSSKPDGSGLGLASVRNFANDVGGEVWIESRVGVGTTVTLQLPVVEQTQLHSSSHPDGLSAETPSSASGKRILLVEDEPYALEALTELLEAEGHFVTACGSSAEASLALGQEAYEVLLTDIVMPGQNGTEIAINALAAQPAIKIILMSGYVPDSALLQPGWSFVSKPMDTKELLKIVSA